MKKDKQSEMIQKTVEEVLGSELTAMFLIAKGKQSIVAEVGGDNQEMLRMFLEVMVQSKDIENILKGVLEAKKDLDKMPEDAKEIISNIASKLPTILRDMADNLEAEKGDGK
jgi:hypothetical protein